MKIINPKAEIISRNDITPYQFIEKIGRTCYKSTDKITGGSAENFVNGLCKRKHYAMLEHYWVHFMVKSSYFDIQDNFDTLAKYLGSMGGCFDLTKHINFTFIENHDLYGYTAFISAPLRVFLEINDGLNKKNIEKYLLGNTIIAMMNHLTKEFPELFKDSDYSYISKKNLEKVVLYMDEPLFIHDLTFYMLGEADNNTIKSEVMKHRTHTVLFVCDRGVSHEMVRHRMCSFAQESTRYCNYSQDKFGKELTFIKPFFFNRFPETAKNVKYDESDYSSWLLCCENSERTYNTLIEKGASPQEARTVLNNSLKTELIVTANEKEWQHIINLRYKGTTGAPHPQIKEVMKLIIPDLLSESDNRLTI